ncbi:M42 family metallopeptidase [Thermoflexus sp.]|uniref:M42 family metallopeptidase n=1 Tax=Thermoflexus sp. TaxID=1969742 RepID=UPI0025E40581|nr:M42 family metallopeptidase [Thermoflexus sp.]MDW8179740.1 M42 family metallopeptidase [Anaerolineae bacterium]MCS6963332.1 M42 family metallopeptidase [Thermoflexus sp.]MCS7350289.1 M42 family metallopeptidase [Thermoflexus sp.]MCX7689614.1 M42 family metallopeptidase [Thermoflexus sp.]MDW8184215.1 M42 family metallopeptidase [Anaerolineae bacterium]
MDELAMLLKTLTEAHGVPGYETEIREVMRRLLEGLGEVEQDNIGSLICRRGEGGPRVMLAAHMDEIGFMVKHITPEGFIRFTALGGWFDQVLLGQRVVIKTHKGDVIGVIGAKPPHLLPSDERKKVVEKKDMYIDIGATSAKEVEEAGVRVGDPIVPLAPFQILANGRTYLAKAFDDRVGCAVLVEVMRRLAQEGHPNTVYGVATVQEEVGLRGAATSVEKVNPEVALILESDIAGDVPGIKPEESPVKLGGGPTIVVYDARMIPNLRLRDLAVETAQSLGIPIQFSVIEGGATDGGVIHLHKGGVPTLVIGVPARHIHSHGAIVHREDVERAIALVTALVQRLDAETVARLKP